MRLIVIIGEISQLLIDCDQNELTFSTDCSRGRGCM